MLYHLDPMIRLMIQIDTNWLIEYKYHFFIDYTYLEHIWQLVKRAKTQTTFYSFYES